MVSSDAAPDLKDIFALNSILSELHSYEDCSYAFYFFLTELKRLIEFEKGDIYFYNALDGHVVFDDFIFVDWAESELDIYKYEYCDIDDALPLVQSSIDSMFRTTDVFISSEREKTRYYKELLEPYGLIYSIEGNIFSDDKGNIGGIGLHRPSGCQDFSVRDLELLKLAKPHLAVIAKRYYQFSKARDAYLKNVPFLSGVKNAGICILDYNFNLIDHNLNEDWSLDIEHKNEIMRSVITLCRSLRSSMCRDKAFGNRMNCKVTVDGKSYFADASFSSCGDPAEGRFVVMIYDNTDIFKTIIHDAADRFTLTDREFELLAYVACGLSNEQISQKMYISVPTVKKHLASIYKKMNIEGRHQILNALL